MHDRLLKLQLNIFATAYSSVRMDCFCKSIGKTKENAEQSTNSNVFFPLFKEKLTAKIFLVVSQLGWSTDSSGNVLPKIVKAAFSTNYIGESKFSFRLI